jgi:hypothetical protein
MKKYAEMRRKERELNEGDMVYLKIEPYRHTSFSLHRSLKLDSNFYGPFRVLKRVGELAYHCYYQKDADCTQCSMSVS